MLRSCRLADSVECRGLASTAGDMLRSCRLVDSGECRGLAAAMVGRVEARFAEALEVTQVQSGGLGGHSRSCFGWNSTGRAPIVYGTLYCQ